MTAWRFLFISLFMHVLLMFLFVETANRRGVLRPNDAVEVTVYDPSQARQAPQSVVRQASPPKNQEKPKNAKFLSEFDQKVEKETRAKASGITRNRLPVDLMPAIRPSKNLADGSSKKPGSAAQDDGVANTRVGQGGSERLKTLGKKLFDAGMSTTGEYLPNVAEGQMTFLNTERFIFYSFFSRIEERIRPLWTRNLDDVAQYMRPADLERMGQKNWVTAIEILLNSEGRFIEAIVESPSGMASLDSAATQAFREAAYFPNPPKGMIKPDGKIHLRISFHVESGRFGAPMANQ